MAFRSSICKMLRPGMGLRLAFVGNSHVLTLFEGYQLIRQQLPRGELTFIAKGPRKVACAIASEGRVDWRPTKGGLVDLVKHLSATHVFVMWRGSQVDVRGLLLSGPAFDVLLPTESARAVDPAVELIPCSVVESAVRESLERDQEFLDLVEAGRRTGARVWLTGPPYALPEDAVRARLRGESHFAARLAELGVSESEVRVVPALVRARLRALLYEAYRDFAAAQGVGFCPPPDHLADASSMLLPPYWGEDITHGSAAYGAAYLQELVTVARSRSD